MYSPIVKYVMQGLAGLSSNLYRFCNQDYENLGLLNSLKFNFEFKKKINKGILSRIGVFTFVKSHDTSWSHTVHDMIRVPHYVNPNPVKDRISKFRMKNK